MVWNFNQGHGSWTKWGLQHHPSAVPLVAGSPDELAPEERMWVTVHLMLILQQNLVEEATAVPDFPALASTVRCTLIPTQMRTPPVSTTLLHYPCDNTNISYFKLFFFTFVFFCCLFFQFPQPAVLLAGGENREPYQLMTSCCMTLMRMIGTRPGWMPGEDCERLWRNHWLIKSLAPKTHEGSLSFCVGTTAKDEQPQVHSSSLISLRLYPAATLSSTVQPAWQLCVWTVRGENLRLKMRWLWYWKRSLRSSTIYIWSNFKIAILKISTFSLESCKKAARTL